MPTTLKILGGSVLKEGDTEPNFHGKLLNGDNTPFDLTDAQTVKFHLRQEGAPSPKVDAEMTVVTATQGEVEYQWADDGTDTDSPGTYEGEVEVTAGDGEITTFPGDGYITVQITEQLA